MIDRFLALVYGALSTIFFLATLPYVLMPDSNITTFWPVVALHVALGAWLAYLSRRRWRQGAANGGALPMHDGKLASGEFYSSVVGVSHKNPDGSDRQAHIKKYCKAGAPLTLEREPQNPHDPNAIAVLCNGVQIGYLRGRMAQEYAESIDDGQIEMTARVKEVTGGTAGRESLGVNIVVTLRETTR